MHFGLHIIAIIESDIFMSYYGIIYCASSFLSLGIAICPALIVFKLGTNFLPCRSMVRKQSLQRTAQRSQNSGDQDLGGPWLGVSLHACINCWCTRQQLLDLGHR